jgi:DNA-binding transcriptional MerR regulator
VATTNEKLRMRDLTRRTGLSRQAIHFYVEQGLVEAPRKTGQTMAYYTEAHVERILLVRKLAEEHFLPLKAIRALLEDRRGELSGAQRRVLSEIKARLPAQTVTVDATPSMSLVPLLNKTGLSRREVGELDRAGLIRIRAGKVTPDDAWVIELWAEVRAAGFTRELGFGVELLQIFERGVAQIFEEEKQILARIAAALPAARVAEMVERALPLVHAYLTRLHQTKVRALFAQVEVV